MTEGEKPDSIDGNITLQDVHFTYPSRKDAKVFYNFKLIKLCHLIFNIIIL